MSCQYGFHFLYSGSPQYIRVFRHIYSDLKTDQKPPCEESRSGSRASILFLEESSPSIFRIWAIASHLLGISFSIKDLRKG